MKTISLTSKLASLLVLIFMCFSGKAQCPTVSNSSSTIVTFTYSTAFGGFITQVTISSVKGSATFSGTNISSVSNSSVTLNLSIPNSGGTTSMNSSDVATLISTTDGSTNQNCSTNVALPVTLTNFEISKKGNDVLFQWQTATEKNSDHFEIEFSNGNEWFYVGSNVAAAGNSENFNSYKFLLKNGEAGMYRLKCIDRDGKFDYSKVKSIFFNDEKIMLYPNPVSSVIVIEGKYTSVTVTNMTGKILINQDQGRVDLSKFEPGIYFIKIENEEKVLVNQMVTKI